MLILLKKIIPGSQDLISDQQWQRQVVDRALDAFLYEAHTYTIQNQDWAKSNPPPLSVQNRIAALKKQLINLDRSLESDSIFEKLKLNQELLLNFYQIVYTKEKKHYGFIADPVANKINRIVNPFSIFLDLSPRIFESGEKFHENIIALYLCQADMSKILERKDLLKISSILFAQPLHVKNDKDIEKSYVQINDFFDSFLVEMHFFNKTKKLIPPGLKKHIYRFAHLKKTLRTKVIQLYEAKEITLSRALQLVNDNAFMDEYLNIKTSVEDYDYRPIQTRHQDRIPFVPTAYKNLGRLMEIDLSQEDVFVDLGCGKGRVAIFMATQNIKKSVGMDVDEKMVHKANLNSKSEKMASLIKSPLEWIHTDVTDYDFSEGTVFYLYNPFGPKTLETVLQKIKTSLIRNPRRIRIVTLDQDWDSVLRSQTWLKQQHLGTDLDPSPLLIWEYRP